MDTHLTIAVRYERMMMDTDAWIYERIMMGWYRRMVMDMGWYWRIIMDTGRYWRIIMDTGL